MTTGASPSRRVRPLILLVLITAAVAVLAGWRCLPGLATLLSAAVALLVALLVLSSAPNREWPIWLAAGIFAALTGGITYFAAFQAWFAAECLDW
jgi:uncharacterized membrane protein